MSAVSSPDPQLVGRELLPPPQEPHPRCWPFGLAPKEKVLRVPLSMCGCCFGTKLIRVNCTLKSPCLMQVTKRNRSRSAVLSKQKVKLKINKNLCGRDGRTICGPQCVPKSTSVTLAVDEKTLPMATITGRTDRRTDRQTDRQTDGQSATQYAAPS